MNEARRLGELEEAVGVLRQVSELEGYCLAVFDWGKVCLPAELGTRLQDLLGKRLGMLRYNGSYRLRIIEKSSIQ
jgi:hypothetical protein